MSNEVISAWDVYLVMQLDSVSCLANALTLLAFAATAICIGWHAMSAGEDHWSWNQQKLPERQEFRRKLRGSAKKAAAVALTFAVITALIPSSKTVAAMIVLPAIANNETVQTEAADLYKLAKKALAEAVSDDDEAKKE
jgi:cobalamin synthase